MTNIDMLGGSIFRGIIAYAVPLILSRLLQLFYNAADLIIIGNFAGTRSLAAVGATGTIVNLLVNFFSSMSVGTTVSVSKRYGANDYDGVKRMVHTSMPFAALCGIVSMIIGLVFSYSILDLMQTPSDIIDKASIYLTIYFIGLPALLIYNFGSAVLMAMGDTRRPLYILTVSGVLNIGMNMVAVIGFKMDVAGVAIATTASNYLSAVLVVLLLTRQEGVYKLVLREMRLFKDDFIEIIRLGLPAGIQSSMFSFANMIMQSAVNSFGSTVIAANSAAGNIEGFVYVSMNAFSQTSTAFVSQNYGANKIKRMKKSFSVCLLSVTVTGVILGVMAFICGRLLLGLYNPDPFVIENGMIRLSIISLTYFLCGIQEVFAGTIRGMGSSFMPMLSSVFGAFVLRIVYIATVFRLFPTQIVLYVTYPLSWIVIILVDIVLYIIMLSKVKKRVKPEEESNSPQDTSQPVCHDAR